MTVTQSTFEGKLGVALRHIKQEFGLWERGRRTGDRISRTQRDAAMAPHIRILAQAIKIDPDRFEPRLPAPWLVGEIRKIRAALCDSRVTRAA